MSSELTLPKLAPPSTAWPLSPMPISPAFKWTSSFPLRNRRLLSLGLYEAPTPSLHHPSRPTTFQRYQSLHRSPLPRLPGLATLTPPRRKLVPIAVRRNRTVGRRVEVGQCAACQTGGND